MGKCQNFKNLLVQLKIAWQKHSFGHTIFFPPNDSNPLKTMAKMGRNLFFLKVLYIFSLKVQINLFDLIIILHIGSFGNPLQRLLKLLRSDKEHGCQRQGLPFLYAYVVKTLHICPHKCSLDDPLTRLLETFRSVGMHSHQGAFMERRNCLMRR